MTTRIRRVERITGIADTGIADTGITDTASAPCTPWLRHRRPRPGR